MIIYDYCYWCFTFPKNKKKKQKKKKKKQDYYSKIIICSSDALQNNSKQNMVKLLIKNRSFNTQFLISENY